MRCGYDGCRHESMFELLVAFDADSYGVFPSCLHHLDLLMATVDADALIETVDRRETTVPGLGYGT